jgi:hypothetical protein
MVNADVFFFFLPTSVTIFFSLCRSTRLVELMLMAVTIFIFVWLGQKLNAKNSDMGSYPTAPYCETLVVNRARSAPTPCSSLWVLRPLPHRGVAAFNRGDRCVPLVAKRSHNVGLPPDHMPDHW